MDAIQRNPDAVSRYSGVPRSGAASEVNAAAYRRNASLQAETPDPANSQTTVTLSPRAQEIAARSASDTTARTGSATAPAPQAEQAEQASVEQMGQINAQLRRAYMGAEGPGSGA